MNKPGTLARKTKEDINCEIKRISMKDKLPLAVVEVA
jgi:hypothetical protein